MLSNDQAPNVLNTGCTAGTLDSADPLAQFPTEDDHDSAETDRAALFAAGGDHSLHAFVSETAVIDAPTRPRSSVHRHSLRALWRLVPMILALVSSCLTAIRICAATLKPLGARFLLSSHDAVDHLRTYLLPRLASFVTALARFARRTAVWAVALIRNFRTSERRRHQFVPLTGGTFRAARQGRRLVTQSHPWTYPAGFFVSGVVAGAFIVTIARVPTHNSVAAQVSEVPTQLTAPQPSAHLNVVEPLPGPFPPVHRPAPIEQQTVSTGGIATRVQQAAARPQPAREQTPRPQAARRTQTAVPVLTDRAGPQSFVGSISINSRPEGAVVFLNGRRVGTTPLLVPDLPVGSRAVRVTMPGYDTWSRAVQVVANQRTTVSATLEELRR